MYGANDELIGTLLMLTAVLCAAPGRSGRLILVKLFSWAVVVFAYSLCCYE